jgi:hypothetical protein
VQLTSAGVPRGAQRTRRQRDHGDERQRLARDAIGEYVLCVMLMFCKGRCLFVRAQNAASGRAFKRAVRRDCRHRATDTSVKASRHRAFMHHRDALPVSNERYRLDELLPAAFAWSCCAERLLSCSPCR